MRRLKCVQIRPEGLADILTRRVHVVDGLPMSAQIKRCMYDAHSDMVLAIFEDESFPETPEGRALPIGGLTVKRN